MARSNDRVNDDLLKRGIQEYCGDEVETLKREPDPQVPGAMALHAVLAKGGYLQFLIAGDAPELRTPEDVALALEECDFGQWPPRTGGPRFF